VIRDLALNRRLVGMLSQLIDGPPAIINSLQFEFGSQQPLHVDTFYMPPPDGGRLIVTSICLEDVHEGAGPVRYVAGSHLLPPFLNSDGTRHVRNPAEEAQASRYYEAMTAERSMAPEPFLGSAGDVLIWHEQLLHGGSPISDLSLTRHSLVTHYFRSSELDPATLRPHGDGFWMERGHQPVPG